MKIAPRRIQQNGSQRSLVVESLEPRQLLTTVELLPSQDNSLFEERDDFSNGAGEYFFIGKIASRGGRFLRRGLISFDVSQIPADATINSVRLQLTMSRTISDANDATLHRVSSSWGEGTSDASREEGTGTDATIGDATWANREFPALDWNARGGDFSSQASAVTSVALEGEYTWSSQGMFDDVGFWLQNPSQNFGWMMLGNEVTEGTAKRFNSKENSNVSTRPKLIVDYDEVVNLPSVTIGDVSIGEGDLGTRRDIKFPVTLSANVTEPVSVDFSLSSGSAVVGSDFESASGTLTFSPNDPLIKTVDVTIIGDDVTEVDEQFTMTLSNPVGLEIAAGTATGTILNDDGEPAIDIADMSVAEGDETHTIQVAVALSNPSAFEITLDYRTSVGSADLDDYEDTSGTITFAPEETSKFIEIVVLGDTIDEADETFAVDLSNPANAKLSNSSVTIELQNDDARPWHNENFPQDVSGDGIVVPFDALLVINAINEGEFGQGELPPPTEGMRPPPYLDVTKDNVLSSRDALLVINWLNDNIAGAVAASAATTAPARRPAPIRINDLAVAALWDVHDQNERNKKHALGFAPTADA